MRKLMFGIIPAILGYISFVDEFILGEVVIDLAQYRPLLVAITVLSIMVSILYLYHVVKSKIIAVANHMYITIKAIQDDRKTQQKMYKKNFLKLFDKLGIDPEVSSDDTGDYIDQLNEEYKNKSKVYGDEMRNWPLYDTKHTKR